MNPETDQIVARFAAPPVTEISEGARELMREIMASASAPEPSKRRRRLGLRVAIPVGALLTAAVMAVTWLMPTTSYAALDIKQEGGYYVIQIKDLYADSATYERQLRSFGLDVTLRVVPSTRAFERQVFPIAPDQKPIPEIKGIDPPGPCDKFGGCAIGVKIPVGFKGTASIEVGRPARPGERYQATTSFDLKGEPMHCVPYINKSVAEVRAMLKERGISIGEFIVADPNPNPNPKRFEPGNYEQKVSVPDSYLVYSGSLTKPGVAMVFASKTPMDQHRVEIRMKGCPSS